MRSACNVIGNERGRGKTDWGKNVTPKIKCRVWCSAENCERQKKRENGRKSTGYEPEEN